MCVCVWGGGGGCPRKGEFVRDTFCEAKTLYLMNLPVDQRGVKI